MYRQSVRARLRTCEHSFRSFEYLDASFINVTNVRVIVIYRPPAVGLSPEIFLDDFSTLLEELIICSEELLIMGDFNLHIDDIENTQAVRFISLLDSFGSNQHVVSPTHRGRHKRRSRYGLISIMRNNPYQGKSVVSGDLRTLI